MCPTCILHDMVACTPLVRAYTVTMHACTAKTIELITLHVM
jgi:hypothetical protein